MQGHEDDQRAKVLSLQSQAERAGIIQVGEEKVLGRLYSNLPVSIGKGEELFTRACSDRTGHYGFKLKEVRFRLNIRKNSTL